jgi:glycosyltransferase involved in cell wall biosynthesis
MSQIRPLVKKLAREGWKISLISMEKSEPSFDLKNEMSQAGVNWMILGFGKRGLIQGVFRIFRLAIFLPKADLYHCRSDLSSLAVILRRGKFLWDVRGLWGEQKFVIGSIRRNRFYEWIFRYIERMITRRASAVTVLAKPLLKVLRERNGKLPTLESVIPTCVDLEHFKLCSKTPKQRTLLLSGSFNNYYDISKTVEIVELLNSKLSFKAIWCRGVESDQDELNLKMTEVRIRRQHEMPKEIALSSLGIALCKSNAGVSLAGVMPTKIAEFLAVGRPVIISRGMGDLDELVTRYQVGILVDEKTDYSKLVNDVLKIIEDPLISLRCRKLAQDHFDLDKAVLKYQEMYEKLLEIS